MSNNVSSVGVNISRTPILFLFPCSSFFLKEYLFSSISFLLVGDQQMEKFDIYFLLSNIALAEFINCYSTEKKGKVNLIKTIYFTSMW